MVLGAFPNSYLDPDFSDFELRIECKKGQNTCLCLPLHQLVVSKALPHLEEQLTKASQFAKKRKLHVTTASSAPESQTRNDIQAKPVVIENCDTEDIVTSMEFLLKLVYKGKEALPKDVQRLAKIANLAHSWRASEASSACLSQMTDMMLMEQCNYKDALKALQLLHRDTLLQYKDASALEFSAHELVCSHFCDASQVVVDEAKRAEFCELPYSAVLYWAGSNIVVVDHHNTLVVALCCWSRSCLPEVWGDRVTSVEAQEMQQRLSSLVRLRHLTLGYHVQVMPLLPWYQPAKQLSACDHAVYRTIAQYNGYDPPPLTKTLLNWNEDHAANTSYAIEFSAPEVEFIRAWRAVEPIDIDLAASGSTYVAGYTISCTLRVVPSKFSRGSKDIKVGLSLDLCDVLKPVRDANSPGTGLVLSGTVAFDGPGQQGTWRRLHSCSCTWGQDAGNVIDELLFTCPGQDAALTALRRNDRVAVRVVLKNLK